MKREPKPISLHNDPVDLSSKNHHNNNNNNDSSKSATDDLPSGLKRDEDCPPGMVRGPNGQLWPAWVFCTRYSDRPSSGEYFLDYGAIHELRKQTRGTGGGGLPNAYVCLCGGREGHYFAYVSKFYAILGYFFI